MRPPSTNHLAVLMASTLLAGYACTSDGALKQTGLRDASPAASGGSTAATSATEGSATGGSGSGGAATGGTTASGGTTTISTGPWSFGGVVDGDACFDYRFSGFSCGGTTVSGGSTIGGGTTATGGTIANGGTVTTGGTITTGGNTGGAGGNSGSSGDAGTTTACSCAGGQITWECYCQAFDCSKTIAVYTADGGAPYVVMREYADCNLVEYWTISGTVFVVDVFDLTTGKLIGQSLGHMKNACPFGGTDAPSYGLYTGRWPESTCVRSKCVESSGSDMCVGIDGGPPRGT